MHGSRWASHTTTTIQPAATRLATTLGPAALLVVVQQALFPMPAGVLVRGLIVGGVTALTALGMALVYRSNRIVNIAQADLGSGPTVLSVVLLQAWGWPYPLAAAAGLASALVLGAVVELAFIRRFRHASRLVLTVATIGLSQLLAGVAVLLPRLFDDPVLSPRIDDPSSATLTIGSTVLRANSLVALVVTPILVAAVAILLRRSIWGVAVRAAADRADRASLLGIAVGRLHTVVWSVAAVLAFAAGFLRAGILGVPLGPALGLGLLLRSLTALVMGRMTNLPAIVASAAALGVLELGVDWNGEQVRFLDAVWDGGVSFDAVLAVVVIVALLSQRRSHGSRTGLDDTSTWQTVDEVRPLAPADRRLPLVRAGRWVVFGVVGVVALALPHLLTVDRSLRASAVVVYAVLGLSFVVLTGWSGQVSLGQVGFFAIGAAVAGKLTITWQADLVVACMVGGLVGAAVAVLVGVPALRFRGLQLAVSSLAFALATTSWALNRRFFDWVPNERVDRLPLLGQIDISSATRIYYVCLGGLMLVVIGLRGIRHSRTGRVLIALRDNEPGAQAYGISAARAKLTAFALGGFIAAFAGGLFVHHQQAYGPSSFAPSANLSVFAIAVVGGVGSVAGPVIGSLWFQGLGWFLPVEWQVVASGVGILAVLLVLPGGLASVLWVLRDQAVAWARRREPPPPDPVDPSPSSVAPTGEPSPVGGAR